MKVSLFAFTILFNSSCLAQIHSDSIFQLSQPGRLHRMQGQWMHQTENSFGVAPTLTLGRQTFLGLSIAKGKFTAGEYGGNGKAIMAGAEYSPLSRIIHYHFSGLLHAYSVIGGLNTQLSMSHYRERGNGCYAIRPQIGVGLLKFFVNYGYNIFLDTPLPNLTKHTVSLSFYITAYPFK